jgi:hypothetical protein
VRVSELIAALAELPADLDVGFGDNEYGWTGIEDVRLHIVHGWTYDFDKDQWQRTAHEVVQLS